MPTTGPIHGPKKPILLYWFDDTKLPLDPNQWVPWSATSGPAISSNNKIWDGAAWVNMVGSTDGRQFTDLDRVGQVDQTGDDWTLRFQALNDESVLGLAQAIGLPALPTTDATADFSVRRYLELILAALGGTVNETIDAVSAVAPGGAPFSAPALFAGAVESVLVLCETADCEVETRKLDGVTWVGPQIITQDAFVVLPVAATAIRVRNRGGAAGPPNATIEATGFRN